MRFRVERDRLSEVAWGEQAILDTTERLPSASSQVLGEVYAYANPTTERNVGLHHEVTEDGEILLNREGLDQAVTELLESDLPLKAKRRSARHLVAHYGELSQEDSQVEIPTNLLEIAGEVQLQGAKPLGVEATLLYDQVSPSQVVPNLAPGVDLTALKAGDDDPLEVVVAVPTGRSTRKWNYTAQALIDAVGEVQASTAAGFLGHQEPDKINHEFLTPVTHWVGARFDPQAPVKDNTGAVIGHGVAYFRGVVDSAARDLKRWIRTKRVTQTSIFGIPTLKTVAGEVNVVGYRLLSIDWTPLKRAGMPSAIVAMGEMDNILGHVTAPTSSGGASTMGKSQDGSPAGDTSEQVGAVSGEQSSGSAAPVATPPAEARPQRIEVVVPDRQRPTADDLYADFRALQIPASAVIGEMGWKAEDFVPQLGLTLDQVGPMVDANAYGEMKASSKIIGEMAGILGLDEGWKVDDVLTTLKTMREQQEMGQKAELERTINEVVGEMVITAQARPLVRRLVPAMPLNSSKLDVQRVIGEMLSESDVKSALSTVFRESVVTSTPLDDREGEGVTTLTRTRKAQL